MQCSPCLASLDRSAQQLADHLNAEVVGGTVCNIQEAANWIQYTYLYVRMLKNPITYKIKYEEKETDPQLLNETRRLVKDAAKLLDERRMIRYDPNSGNLAVTDLGRVASHFYIQVSERTERALRKTRDN